MFKIGDRVQVGSRIGAPMMSGTVVGVIPAIADRVAMYRIRFDDKVTGPTLTNNPNELWVDEGMLYFHHSN